MAKLSRFDDELIVYPGLVELQPAAVFTCPDCGQDQYIPIVTTITKETDDDFEYVSRYPDGVFCVHCNKWWGVAAYPNTPSLEEPA